MKTISNDFTLQWTYQFLVFILHFQPGGYAIASVEERFPLGMLHQIMHENSDNIRTREDYHVRRQLQQKRSGRTISNPRHKDPLKFSNSNGAQ